MVWVPLKLARESVATEEKLIRHIFCQKIIWYSYNTTRIPIIGGRFFVVQYIVNILYFRRNYTKRAFNCGMFIGYGRRSKLSGWELTALWLEVARQANEISTNTKTSANVVNVKGILPLFMCIGNLCICPWLVIVENLAIDLHLTSYSERLLPTDAYTGYSQRKEMPSIRIQGHWQLFQRRTR